MEIEKNTKHFSFGAGVNFIAGISDLAGRTAARANMSEIIIDASSMNMNGGTSFKGLGCISASGCSKLLLDYKTLYPEVYSEILNLLFKKDYGVQLSHIKIELGCDINAVSCTEPCVMRFEEEQINLMRSPSFILVSDALKVNPELTVELVRYSDPKWVKDAFSENKRKGYRARYKWFLETIKSAYRVLGIKLTHISPDKNGTESPDTEWLIYFAKRLKSEKNKFYDYGKIKLVSSGFIPEILENQMLKNSIDIIGLNRIVYNDYKKEVWYSDGKSPSNVPRFSINCDGSGISGKNSILDIASEIIKGLSGLKMTMYEFMPAAAGYYDGTSNFPSQLITANTPWSGHYSVNSGFFMAMHFTRFIGKDWRFIESACNAGECYITAMPEDKSELTMIFCNNTSKTKGYSIDLSNCNMTERSFGIVETKPPLPNQHYAQNWFRFIADKKPSKGCIYIEVKANSLLTLTTIDTSFVNGVFTVKMPSEKKKRLKLPYNDSFCYPESFFGTRGTSPLLTSDIGGCFEISGKILQQKITDNILPENGIFRDTPAPITCIGDDTWVNYSAEIEFLLESSSGGNYAGIGVHYDSPCACEDSAYSGCSVRIYGNGHVQIYFMDKIVSSFNTDNLNKNSWNKIKILALANIYMVYLNDKFIGDFEEKNILCPCGKVSLLSSFYANKFRNLKINPVSGTIEYADRIDALSSQISYTKDAVRDSEVSYKYSNRTNVKVGEYTSFQLEYSGYGFALCGTVEQAEIDIEFDGRKIENEYIIVGGTKYRQSFYRMKNMDGGTHSLKVTVISGEIILDSVLAFNNSENIGAANPQSEENVMNIISSVEKASTVSSVVNIFKKIGRKK